VDSISLSASIADCHHTYESVSDRGSVPIPRCHAEGSAEVRTADCVSVRKFAYSVIVFIQNVSYTYNANWVT